MKEKDGNEEICEMLADLMWLNGLIATELIQLTENSSMSLRGDVPQKCKLEHKILRERVISIVSKHSRLGELGEHVLGHQ